MTKEILEILDNVRYWETCPDNYKETIEKFLADNNQALQLQQRELLFAFEKFKTEHIPNSTDEWRYANVDLFLSKQ